MKHLNASVESKLLAHLSMLKDVLIKWENQFLF